MNFPRVDHMPSGRLMLITGRRVLDDGTEGCLVGHPVDAHLVQRELERLAALSKHEPMFEHREWPVGYVCRCWQCREKAAA